METLTITEALAEIKTIGKRLSKKREFISGYLARQNMLKDPLEREGGSVEAIRQARQSIHDLEERIILIRRAITRANEATPLVLNGLTRSLGEWLVWRRDIAGEQQRFLQSMQRKIMDLREQARQKGIDVVGNVGDAKSHLDLVVNIDERELASQIESLEEVLGTLDGRLSLINATTMVEV